mgnify:CR=1 FL=1
MIEDNPWHAVNHFREASHLGPSDREAAETLWKRYSKADKRAKRLERRERVLTERVKELESAMAAIGGER